MTEREKIVKIIEKNGTYNGRSLSFDYYVVKPDDLADALIAAGLVADVQSLADGNCVLYVKGKGFMRLYNEQDINEMRHRAEVAERACRIATDKIYDYSYEEAIAQAERELGEEGKR